MTENTDKQFIDSRTLGTFTPDDIIKTEELEEPIPLSEEEQLKAKRKEFITKVKVIALSRCGKNPLSNPSTFDFYEKLKVKDMMATVLTYTEDEIDSEFKSVCIERIYANPDYLKYSNV